MNTIDKTAQRDDLVSFTFLTPWEPMDGGFEEQLTRETSPQHNMYGTKARSIARSGACDDVLFALTDAPAPFAVVHLTWSDKADEFGGWSGSTLYNSLEDWAKECMYRDYIWWARDTSDSDELLAELISAMSEGYSLVEAEHLLALDTDANDDKPGTPNVLRLGFAET